MPDSVQHKLNQVRPPRVRITYDVETGDSIIKKELPFVMGIIADLSGDRELQRPAPLKPYKERPFVFIDRDNFDQVLAEAKPALELSLPPSLREMATAAAPAKTVKKSKATVSEDSDEAGNNNVPVADTVADSQPKGKKIQLFFEKLTDFEPKSLVTRVPELAELLSRRGKLQDMAAKLDSNDELHDMARELISDQNQRKELLAQLQKLAEARASAPDALPVDGSQLAVILKAMARDPSQTGIILGMLREFLLALEGRQDSLPPMQNVVQFLTMGVAALDTEINRQVNAILHDPAFQALESTWRGLQYLVKNAQTGEQLKLRLLNASFKELGDDLGRAVEFDQSFLFRNIYEEEYGTFGGEPYSCLLHVHEYGRSPGDVDFLIKLSEVAAAAHLPTITAAAPALFDLNSFTELANPRDLQKVFATADCIQWRSFREREDARYINMCLPRMLMRMPYELGSVEDFAFVENVDGFDHGKYLWGNAAFGLAFCILRAFTLYGWTAAIRGVEGGGLLDSMPVHVYTRPSGDKVPKIPTEIAITDRREKELSDLGFVALLYRRGTDKAAFFGSQSVHKPPQYAGDDANANARASARLPYLLNASRFAHYLKSLVRDKIGSFSSAESVAGYLNNWISQYVLLSDSAGQESKARYPLREARVDVYDEPGNPGAYKATVYLRPHFQLEELTASIRLVASLPAPLGAALPEAPAAEE